MISLFIDVQPYFLKNIKHRKDYEKLVLEEYSRSKKENNTCIIIESVRTYNKKISSKSIIGDSKDIIIQKEKANGFLNTNLEKTLLQMNDKDLLISGIYTPWCVFETAYAAKKKKYNLFSREKLLNKGDFELVLEEDKKAMKWIKQNITYLE